MLPWCEAINRRVFEGGGDGRHGHAASVLMASGEREVSSGGQRAAVVVGACGRPTHARMVPPWNMDTRGGQRGAHNTQEQGSKHFHSFCLGEEEEKKKKRFPVCVELLRV